MTKIQIRDIQIREEWPYICINILMTTHQNHPLLEKVSKFWKLQLFFDRLLFLETKILDFTQHDRHIIAICDFNDTFHVYEDIFGYVFNSILSSSSNAGRMRC